MTDVHPSTPRTASVTARPVDCSAPLPSEHASWRRFPRAVPLQTGDTLVLGEPLPRESLSLEHDRRNTFWVRERPVGLFSGATQMRVGMDQEDPSARSKCSSIRMLLSMRSKRGSPRVWDHRRIAATDSA